MKKKTNRRKPGHPTMKRNQSIPAPSPIEDLERPQAQGHEAEPTVSMRPGFAANPGRIVHKERDQKHRQDADGDIDVKRPAPRPGIGLATRHVGPRSARRGADAIEAWPWPRLAGESFPQDGLGERLERAAAAPTPNHRQPPKQTFFSSARPLHLWKCWTLP